MGSVLLVNKLVYIEKLNTLLSEHYKFRKPSLENDPTGKISDKLHNR